MAADENLQREEKTVATKPNNVQLHTRVQPKEDEEEKKNLYSKMYAPNNRFAFLWNGDGGNCLDEIANVTIGDVCLRIVIFQRHHLFLLLII